MARLGVPIGLGALTCSTEKSTVLPMLPLQENGGLDRLVQSTVQFSLLLTGPETGRSIASGPMAAGPMLHCAPSVDVWLTFTVIGPNGPLLCSVSLVVKGLCTGGRRGQPSSGVVSPSSSTSLPQTGGSSGAPTAAGKSSPAVTRIWLPARPGRSSVTPKLVSLMSAVFVIATMSWLALLLLFRFGSLTWSWGTSVTVSVALIWWLLWLAQFT